MHAIRTLLDLVYPRVCLLCSHLLLEPDHRAICGGCLTRLEPIVDACRKCGAPAKSDSHASGSRRGRRTRTCLFCRNRRWSFQRMFAFTVYRGSAMRVARYMKEPNCEPLARQVGDAVGQWLLEREDFLALHYDLIVPVPQHWLRRLTLRYNQADVLARRIAQAIDQPVRDGWLRRSRWTPKQGLKTVAERIANVQGAFVCKPRPGLLGRRVLLVDDVMTSGATLDQAAQALRTAGAIHVDAVVFARGVGAHRPALTRPTLTQPNLKPPVGSLPAAPRSNSSEPKKPRTAVEFPAN